MRLVAPSRIVLFSIYLLASTLLAGIVTGRGIAADLQVVDLRCEYLTNPLAIDQVHPRLSWRLEATARGARQTAYRILVASSPEKLTANEGDLWDTGRVESRETLNIAYQGQQLTSRQTCYWKVHVWGQAGSVQQVDSGVAQWSMGLLNESDWTAQYISYRDTTAVHTSKDELFLPPARQYRKAFSAGQQQVRRAVVYATALGIYELYLNGQRVSDHWFAPGWTDYHQRAYYRAYDVTQLVQSGQNAIGAWVADGWYSGYVGFGLLTGIGTEQIGRYTYGKTPSFMAQLEIEYDDGTREVVVSDPSWKVTSDGPIREADLLMGEVYDATREISGWTEPGFDDQSWEAAIAASENGHPEATFYEFQNASEPGGKVEKKGRQVDLGFHRPKLEAFPGVPVRVLGELPTKTVTELEPGKTIFNLGQNFAGTIRLHIQGPAGTVVTLRYGEMLHPDGRLMTENLRKARATDTYILKGDPAGETYIPRFTFHGFQYVEATVNPATALTQVPQITGLVLHSDTTLTSTFECSDTMANRLYQNVVWTQRANFLDLPTDCPQRDERMGWTGDAQVYVGTAAYNADVAAFYTKWLRELMESQRPSGAFPGYAPFPFQHGWDFGTAWADAGIICPWTIWQVYGDTRVIEACWQPMTRFMQWRQETSQNYLGIAHGNNWGDWLAQGAATPLEYIDTVYFAISTNMMAQMAAAVGREEEAAAYRELFGKICDAFNQKYVQSDGSITVPTQTAYAIALFADLIPVNKRRATGKKLADMIVENGTRMSTGFIGTRPLLPVLTSVGQHDLAMFLFQSREFPSWGYEVEQGATTIWERWDSYTKEDGFGRHNAAMNSFAHYSFGAVCEWMFNTLAGIRHQEPGYQKILIRPRPAAPKSNAEREVINWVKASYQSPRGMIVSSWRIDGTDFHLDVEIPANTTATVVIPATELANVTEGDGPVDKADGVRMARYYRNVVLLSINAGSYQFHSIDAITPANRAYKTTPPPDNSMNPEAVDLGKANVVKQWDFTNDADIANWPGQTNLRIEQRDGKTILVGTGNDPQWETELEQAVAGNLALALVARPSRAVRVEFFWAGPQGGFRAGAANGRELKETSETQTYLFRIGGNGPIKKLRFDPLQNEGELQVDSVTLYRLPKE